MGRGKGWTSDEDMFLARSVVQVSHDPVIGADQRSSKYYNRVLQQFLIFSPGSNRTPEALSNRWKEIQSSCSKFAGYLATSKAQPKSGEQEDYYIEEAFRIFLDVEKTAFKFQMIWEYLRKNVPKFEQGLTPKSMHSKRLRPEHDAVVQDDSEDRYLSRPPGCKKAKEKSYKKDEIDDADCIEVQKSYVAENRRRNDLTEEQNRLALFAVNLSALDETAREFYNLKRKVELAKLKKLAEEMGI